VGQQCRFRREQSVRGQATLTGCNWARCNSQDTHDPTLTEAMGTLGRQLATS
jgi:hypothetical protein